MRIAVSGASGLIGTTLVPALRDAGHEVLRLVRHDAARADEIAWDPARRRLEPQALAGVDAVIHLAGVGVGDHRWTNAYKAQILSSRVDGTLTLARAIANAQPRARVLLSASGIDYYAKAAAAAVDEGAPAGSGFLAQTCVAWERATAPAEEAGVRVVHLRTGIVLARNGGSLGRMLPLFRLGLGGRLGSGRQVWSWISLPDYCSAMQFLLSADGISGPVNLTAPGAVTNAEFTAALARVVHRPALLPVPATALRLALGGLADEGVLAGQRVRPAVLEAAGFTFAHPDIDTALGAVL